MAVTDINIGIERTDRPSSQRKIAKILAAARVEFFANGFSATSIEAIAARAEVSKVTVYSWFQSKENLFGEVVKAECCDMSQNYVVENLQTMGLRETLILAAESMMNFVMRDEIVRFDRILAAEVNRDPKIGQYFLDNGPRALLGNLITLLQSSIDKGEIKSADPQSSAEMFAALVFGRIDVFLRYGEKISLTPEERRERAERAVDAWMLIHQN
ncbi:TetR/AcrR family transcriptional regulator [Parasphingorhabdus sp.]|uniref:TetR/AcrR family transcriptional regulator n=1 Tax=Parasphingorhabdus sp. TaxID=2709688 RepID=UPI003593E439